eukprot:321374-Amorphochlora_amoeboformis.AAC.1
MSSFRERMKMFETSPNSKPGGKNFKIRKVSARRRTISSASPSPLSDTNSNSYGQQNTNEHQNKSQTTHVATARSIYTLIRFILPSVTH